MGASSGIGRLAALEFARRGARVVVAARDAEGLDTLVDEIRTEQGKAVSVTADVTDFDQVNEVARAAVDHYGRLDTWVHLAGVSLYSAVRDMMPDEFKQVIDVNLVGQAYGAMAALPHLRHVGSGAFISVTSIEAFAALPLQSAYAASKHGVHGFLESLRLELRHEGLPISVTEIIPSTMNTPLFDKARTRLGVKPKGQPPVYEPEVTVATILYAAEHPVRAMVAGGGGRLLTAMRTATPRLALWFLGTVPFSGQRTNEPRSVTAPDNLFEPVAGLAQVRGNYGGPTRRTSVYTTLTTSRWFRPVLTGALLGAGLLALNSARGGARRRDAPTSGRRHEVERGAEQRQLR